MRHGAALKPGSLACAVLAAAALGGCASGPPPVAACPQVPPPHGAMMPIDKPPVSAKRLILKPGHWEWNGHAYIWSSPEWVDIPEGTRILWIDGFWTPAGGGCFWTAGRFISSVER